MCSLLFSRENTHLLGDRIHMLREYLVDYHPTHFCQSDPDDPTVCIISCTPDEATFFEVVQDQGDITTTLQ